MAKHDAQAAGKRARNEAYAAKFKRRSPSERKALRAARTAERERRWLVAHGITPIVVKPLATARRRTRRR